MKFKRGDLVKIKSKSAGRALRTVNKLAYDITKPQQIERVDGNKIIVIKGDYYKSNDIELVYGGDDIDVLFDKLIEEL